MGDKSIEAARIRFCQLAEEYWEKIGDANSAAANASTRRSEKLVADWGKKQLIFELLSPLLDHESAKIRFSSAAYLMNHDSKASAIRVLRDLVKNQNNLISTSAAAVLRIHRISSE